VGQILSAIKVPVTSEASAWVKKEAPHFLPRMLDIQPGGRQIVRFWQRGGGYDRNIWSAQEAHEKIGYIHKNPVRRGLVQNPADWPWSSYMAWTSGSDEPLALDRSSLPPAGGP
jgi:putative transposase